MYLVQQVLFCVMGIFSAAVFIVPYKGASYLFGVRERSWRKYLIPYMAQRELCCGLLSLPCIWGKLTAAYRDLKENGPIYETSL